MIFLQRQEVLEQLDLHLAPQHLVRCSYLQEHRGQLPTLEMDHLAFMNGLAWAHQQHFGTGELVKSEFMLLVMLKSTKTIGLHTLLLRHRTDLKDVEFLQRNQLTESRCLQ